MGIPLFIEQYIPFLIIFIVLYAILKKSKIFGESSLANKVNILFSLTISFLLVFYNPLNINWAFLFVQIYSNAMIVLAFVAFFAIFALIYSALRPSDPNKPMKLGLEAIIFGLIFASIFAYSTGLFLQLNFPEISNLDINYSPVLLVAGLIILVILFVKFVV